MSLISLKHVIIRDTHARDYNYIIINSFLKTVWIVI